MIGNHGLYITYHDSDEAQAAHPPHVPQPVLWTERMLLFPPNLSLPQPNVTRPMCTSERAPAHMMQGSHVTYK
jgi:hypothetical protein